MWRVIGAVLLFLAGCILVPIAFVALLFMRPRDVEPWRPMPPPRR